MSNSERFERGVKTLRQLEWYEFVPGSELNEDQRIMKDLFPDWWKSGKLTEDRRWI